MGATLLLLGSTVPAAADTGGTRFDVLLTSGTVIDGSAGVAVAGCRIELTWCTPLP